MSSSPLVRLAASGLLVAVLTGCGPVTSEQGGRGDGGTDTLDVSQVPAAADGIPAADAELADASWRQVAGWIRRENDAGRPVVVNLFASWCGPCKRELPLLIEVAMNEPDVTFLGVAHEDQLAAAEALVREFDVPFATLYDPDGEAFAALGARAMPTTVVFDRDGRLVDRAFGELTPRRLEQLLSTIR